jgi:HlyD family secretion protein
MKQLERPQPQSNGRTSTAAGLPPKFRTRRIILVAIVGIAVLIAAVVVFRIRAGKAVAYITSRVVQKDLVQTVTATGTVNPQNTILVGTQVSGTITELGADYNSVVKKDQILARIDPTSFQAQLSSAQAAHSQATNTAVAGAANANSAEQNTLATAKNVAAAREALASAQSQVAKTKAALDLANLTLRRDRQLLAQGFIAQAQADTDTSNAVAAKAAYDASRIAVTQASAQYQAQLATQNAAVAQAQSAAAGAVASRSAIGIQTAAVATARYNFENTVIRSPVNGTVIARNVSIGQTVAASFQTPTLFTMAQDLSKMQVDVAVGEPDVGGVRAGDVVDFTVLAYPNRTFHGVVYQVRQNPTTVSNVVTYDTVVYVDNKDGALYPGMTANASIHVAKATAALVVPIAALQYAPPERTRVTSANAPVATSQWGMTEASFTRTIVGGRVGRLFTLRAGKLVRVPVRVILVSNTEAAVTPSGAALAAGDTVVTADTSSQSAGQQAAPTSALIRPVTSGRPGGGGGR